MSSIIALSITYALLATDNSMVKGPRRAAQLCCTRPIFTAIAPRSIEKLLNTRRTLSIVAQSDGFPYVRECGFYEDCDDEFCISILQKIFHLQKVAFSRGCKISVKTGDFLLSVPFLKEISMYVEDEFFPVEAVVKLLKHHRSESVRASVANTIVIHEQDNRGKNTRTLMELRRLGADKILFDLIESPVQDVESLGKYAGALGSLTLSWTRTDLGNPELTLPAQLAENEEFLQKIQQDGTAASRLTPKYVVDNIIPIYTFLSHCGESATVRGAAHLMLGSCTARGEFSDICEEVFTSAFFQEELLPNMQHRLKPMSPQDALIFNGVDWIGMRDQVFSSNSMGSAATFSATFSPTPSRNYHHQQDQQQNEDTPPSTAEKQNHHHHHHHQREEAEPLVERLLVSTVPSAEEREFSKSILKKQTELSYFSWVLQNCAQSPASRGVLLSDPVLLVLADFLTVYKKPVASTRTIKNNKNNESDQEDDDDEEENDDESDPTLLKKENTAFIYSRHHPERCDVAAYTYSIEARHRIFDTVRFCVGQERILNLSPQHVGGGAGNNNQQNPAARQQQIEQGKDNVAKLTQNLIKAGILQKFLDNVDAGAAEFRSNETFLELVVATARFVPTIAVDAYDPTGIEQRKRYRRRHTIPPHSKLNNSPIPIRHFDEEAGISTLTNEWDRVNEMTAEEIKTFWMLLEETSFLRTFLAYFLKSADHWTKLLYENRFVKEYHENGKKKKSASRSKSKSKSQSRAGGGGGEESALQQDEASNNNNNNENQDDTEEDDEEWISEDSDYEDEEEDDEEEEMSDDEDDEDNHDKKLDSKISDAQKRVKKHLAQIRRLKEELLHSLPTCLNVLQHLGAFMHHFAFLLVESENNGTNEDAAASVSTSSNDNLERVSKIWKKNFTSSSSSSSSSSSPISMKYFTDILTKNSFEFNYDHHFTQNNNNNNNNNQQQQNWWNRAAASALDIVNQLTSTSASSSISASPTTAPTNDQLLDTFFTSNTKKNHGQSSPEKTETGEEEERQKQKQKQQEANLWLSKKTNFFWNRVTTELGSKKYYDKTRSSHLGYYRELQNQRVVADKYTCAKALETTFSRFFTCQNASELFP